MLSSLAGAVSGGELNQIISQLPSGYATLFGRTDLAGRSGQIVGARGSAKGSPGRRTVRSGLVHEAVLDSAGKKVIKVAVSSGSTTRTAASAASGVETSTSLGWGTIWRRTTG